MFFNEDNNLLLNEQEEVLNENIDETIIMENLIMDAGVELFTEEELMALYEANLLSERSIVRLDKLAHRNRAIKKAALQLAKENNDPLYRKLKWVYRRKKELIDAITAKYGNRATAKVRKFKFSAKGRVDNLPSNRQAAKAINKALANSSVKRSKDL